LIPPSPAERDFAGERASALAVCAASAPLWDIVTSNITVARQVLGPLHQLQPAWVVVPPTLTHPTAISLIAGCHHHHSILDTVSVT
jgi:multisubunit Na+/H+ antiporter MnhE subunit